MKKLNFIKEKSKVCRIKFKCIFKGLPLVDMVTVDFKELVLTSPYEDRIFKFNEKHYQGYDVSIIEEGFEISLYFFEPEDEEDFDNSINYQFGEGFEVNIEKSNITFSFKNQTLNPKWAPTIDDILEREEYIYVNDDIFTIIENFKNIFPNKTLLTFLYKEVLKGLDTVDIERLALISKL